MKTNNKNFEIIVVDNASNDNSVELLKEKYPKIKIIVNKKNYGYAKGNNIGAKYAKGKYLVFLNNDVNVDKNWLRELVKSAKKENLAVCQPKILSLKDKNRFDDAGAAGGFFDLYGYSICRGSILDNFEIDKGQYNDSIEIFWAGGAAFFIDKNIFNKAGGFDENHFLYYDEADLCWRIHLMGYKIKYVPKSMVYHYGEASSRKILFKKFYYLHRNHMFTLLKNYSVKNLFKYFPVALGLDFISAFYFLFRLNFKRSLAIFLSLFWPIYNINLILQKRRKINRLRKVSDDNIINLMVKTNVPFNYFLLNKKKFSDYKKYI